MLESSQNPYVKHLVKLAQDSSYRLEQGKVLLEGRKLITEILPLLQTGTLFTTEENSIKTHLETVLISKTVAAKLTQIDSSEGVFLEIAAPAMSSLKGINRLLAFDAVSDPGNLGTLMRTALALNWKGLFFLPDCCDPFNSKVIRASKGAIFHMPYLRGTWKDLNQIIEREGLTPLAADIKGDSPHSLVVQKPLLVLGNEGKGLSLESKSHCRRISIPINNEMESLNVAIAGAILMYCLRDNELDR